MSKKIRSRYIVDVDFEKEYVKLTDSNHVSYYISTQSMQQIQQLKASFTYWFKDIFSKGINQFLTVFEYKEIEHDGQIDLVIEKFINPCVCA